MTQTMGVNQLPTLLWQDTMTYGVDDQETLFSMVVIAALKFTFVLQKKKVEGLWEINFFAS